jgi:hypothetical protein
MDCSVRRCLYVLNKTVESGKAVINRMNAKIESNALLVCL